MWFQIFPKYYKLEFYVPPASAEAVKQAVFAAGAGKYGKYSNCCWCCSGEGEFIPLTGAEPFIGEIGQSGHVTEIKVELICHRSKISAALEALKKAHPYETPAFNYYPIKIL
ncbi:MAG: hypothetical protein RRY34_07990 [Victivallaceae bacterium]